MNNWSPPTDNIYKFYAVGGLLVFAISLYGIVQTVQSTNHFLYELIIELDRVERRGASPENTMLTREVLNRRIEAVKVDRER